MTTTNAKIRELYENGELEGVGEHGNDAHTEDYVTSSDTFSGNYSDLASVPSTFTPEEHGNDAHT
ncbi:hypothetical protein, partial [Natrialba aegyptia]